MKMNKKSLYRGDFYMKIKIAILIIIASLFLTACDLGKEDIIKEIRYDLSVEYNVPIQDINVEEIEYGISVFTTNQCRVKIESKDLAFYLIEKNNDNNFRRIPIVE